MAEKVQINLRVDPAQKERWEDYVEESERFVTLSSFIRTSVEAQISDSEPAQQEASPALANDVQDLHEEVTAIRKNVSWVREQLQDEVDISELAQAVFDTLEPLPEQPEPIEVPDDMDMSYEEYQRHLQAKRVIEPHGPGERRPQTAGAIADRVDATPKRVEDAIEYLEDQFLPVVAIDYDGQRQYFKTE